MNLEEHILRASAFSTATFGPGRRTEGVLNHMEKEIQEVRKSKDYSEQTLEWVDLFILSLDGLSRHLMFDEQGNRTKTPEITVKTLCNIIKEKQAINEGRNWPYYKNFSEDQPIEHDRSNE